MHVGSQSQEKIQSQEFEAATLSETEEEDIRQKQGRFFYYGTPLSEETGVWIPVSIPPMSESEHEEWTRGFCLNGGYIPDGDIGWSKFVGGDKELTMWDIST